MQLPAWLLHCRAVHDVCWCWRCLLFLVVFWRWDLRVNCIKGEIHNIIASLRLGWAAQIAFLSDFKALHEQLCEVRPPANHHVATSHSSVLWRRTAERIPQKADPTFPCVRFRRGHRSAKSTP